MNEHPSRTQEIAASFVMGLLTDKANGGNLAAQRLIEYMGDEKIPVIIFPKINIPDIKLAIMLTEHTRGKSAHMAFVIDSEVCAGMCRLDLSLHLEKYLDLFQSRLDRYEREGITLEPMPQEYFDRILNGEVSPRIEG